jgi:hypothetical protein
MRRDEARASSLSGFASAELPRTKRLIVEKEVVVTVLHDKDVFERFNFEAYKVLELRWQAVTGARSVLPFTEVEYLKYGYTAVKTRVSRVNNERFHTRCDDHWALNPVLAAVLAGVGLVMLETPAVTFRPKWNVEHDSMLLTMDEQRDMTRRIKSLVDVQNLGFVPILAISGDRSGLKEVMNLIPARDEMGQVKELKSYYDFAPIAAVAYLIGGLSPELWTGTALPEHPQLLPAYFIEKAVLLSEIYYKLSEMGVGK